MIDPLSKKLLDLALEQDVGSGDITSKSIVDKSHTTKTYVVCKQTGVLAGIEEATYVLKNFSKVKVKALKKDGERVRKGTKVLSVEGNAINILQGERIAVNILARMSGIATFTSKMVTKGMKVAATRKSPPGLLFLDKKAVKIGGGLTHRKALWDAILIKDNHLNYLVKKGVSKKEAIFSAVEKTTKKGKVEIEVENLKEALWALQAGADIIMLDNFTPMQAKNTITALRKRDAKIGIELSGGITDKNISSYAKLGADFLSMGQITNSVKVLDFSMEIDL